MMDLQALLILLMFLLGVVFIGGYVLLWLSSPSYRRAVETPKHRMLELDRQVWGDRE
jgi:uncharacterized membrane protein